MLSHVPRGKDAEAEQLWQRSECNVCYALAPTILISFMFASSAATILSQGMPASTVPLTQFTGHEGTEMKRIREMKMNPSQCLERVRRDLTCPILTQAEPSCVRHCFYAFVLTSQEVKCGCCCLAPLMHRSANSKQMFQTLKDSLPVPGSCSERTRLPQLFVLLTDLHAILNVG